MSTATITFRVYRYSPGDPESGRFEDISMPVEQTTTVLDVLEKLRGRDPSLMYRHSCHHGSCGTCACRINGRERLACLTRVLDLDAPVVTVEPLRKLKKLGDLVVDPTDFFREFPADWQTLRRSDANPEAEVPTDLSVPGYPGRSIGAAEPPQSSGFMRLENCIECGACVSACPVGDFLGPAVLAGLNRQRTNRPDREEELLETAAGARGVRSCRRALECSRVCPTAVYPARHIEELRKKLSDNF